MGWMLDQCLRRFIAEGSGLSRRDNPLQQPDSLGTPPQLRGNPDGCPEGQTPLTPENKYVIPGNSKGARPTGTYASLLLTQDKRLGYPVRRGTDEMVYRRAVYSLQFYRENAVAYAQRFDAFCMSEVGLTYANTAFSDGRIAGARVLRGGSGYQDVPSVEFVTDPNYNDGTGARAVAVVANGRVAAIRMLDFGKDYLVPPCIQFQGGSPTQEAQATARGFGFRVRFPLEINRLDVEDRDEWEECATIELSIDYATFYPQTQTERIDTVEATISQSTVPEDRDDPPPPVDRGSIVSWQPAGAGTLC